MTPCLGRYTLAGKMKNEIPDWLGKTASVIDNKHTNEALRKQVEESEQTVLAQKYDLEKQVAIDNIEKDAVRGLNTWDRLSIDEIIDGVAIVFSEKYSPVVSKLEIRVLGDKIHKDGNKFEVTTGWGTGHQVVSENIRDIISEIVPYKMGFQREAKGVSYQYIHIDQMTKKIQHQWITSGGGGFDDQWKTNVYYHYEDIFEISLKDGLVWASIGEKPSIGEKKWIKILTLNDNSNSNNLKDAVDDFISKII